MCNHLMHVSRDWIAIGHLNDLGNLIVYTHEYSF